MGLERRGQRFCFYEKVRQGGRVVSRYVAAGDLARELGQLAAEEAEQRRAEREQLRAWRERLDARSQSLRQAAELAGRIAGWWLEAHGFHRPGRHRWRRRAGPWRVVARIGAASEVRMPLEIPAPVGSCRHLPLADHDVVRRARSGDPGALPALRALFARDPAGLLRCYGDLVATDLEAAADRIAGDDLPRREALPVRLAALVRDLEGDDPGPAVALLARQVALCWLDRHDLEIHYHVARVQGESLAKAVALERLRRGASRRYLRAIATLEGVRRLQAPGPAPADLVVELPVATGGPVAR